MTTKDEALKLALEPVGTYGEIYESMHSLLRSGLQRDQQIYMAMKDKPLYATPPAAQWQWVGLTDEEIRQDASWFFPSEWWAVCKDFARTIENELKEKNSD